jgi:hypothetical protein
VTALEEFGALGIDFVSLSESVDTSTPMGKMIFTVLSAVAELERNLIRERIAMGLDRARKQKKALGRPRRIFDRDKAVTLRSQGKCLREIVTELGIGKRHRPSCIRPLTLADPAPVMCRAGSFPPADIYRDKQQGHALKIARQLPDSLMGPIRDRLPAHPGSEEHVLRCRSGPAFVTA